MAIMQYGDITIPEIPASELPYVIISKNGTGWRVCFSSEPFIAVDIATGVHISLMGRYGCYTAAAVPIDATVKVYNFFEEDGIGWDSVGLVTLSTHSGGSNYLNYGGEDGKTYYLLGSLQQTNWCNSDVMWFPDTLVQQASGDPILVKETFPIQEFTTYLMTAWQASKAMPFVESGGDS